MQELKTQTLVKSTLMNETGFSKWQDVEAAVPELANSGILEKFHLQKGKPLPKRFQVPHLLIYKIT